MAGEAYRNRRPACTPAVLALAFLLAAAPGCASRRFDALMRSWEGRSVDELYRTWGPPNLLYSDGKGGRVVVYIPTALPGASRTSLESERLRAAASTRVYDPAMKTGWPIFRIFFVDEKGRLGRTEWRGRWECCSG